MDLIAVDIGNTNITLGLFTHDDLKRTERTPAGDTEKLAQNITLLREMCGPQPLGARTVPVVASSVNPTALGIVERTVADLLDQNILLAGRDVPLDIKLAVENPKAIGTDRLLNAAAAYDMINGPLVVADFGTAITIDCVSAQGIFLGGAILPGLNASAAALARDTAALPQVAMEIPPTNYGTNTESAIQAGIYYGAIGALRELVERFANQLGQWPHVILTGGNAELIAKECNFADSVVPNLCLTGLYLAYVKFRTATQDENIS